MPFTVSHVAAVLPVVGRSRRLPAAALVLGSMAPDYPWFITHGRTGGLSHSPLGVVTVDLAIGLVAVVVWWRWVQAPVRDLLPRAVGARLPRPHGLVVRRVPWAALAVVIGAGTHVVWDSFTHAGRWGVEAVPWLQEAHRGVAGYVRAQDVSSVVGLGVLVVWGLHRLAQADRDDAGLRSTPGERRAAVLVATLGATMGALVGATRFPGAPVPMLYGIVTLGGLGLLVGAAFECAMWWGRTSRPAELAAHRE